MAQDHVMSSTKPFEASGSSNSLDLTTLDTPRVSKIRVVLAISLLLTISIIPVHVSRPGLSATLLVVVYAAYSIVLWLSSVDKRPPTRRTFIYWIDLGFIGTIIALTGGLDSILLPGFFFPIIAASFRFGMREGAKLTFGCMAALGACSFPEVSGSRLARLILSFEFFLIVGYFSAYWGESRLRLQKRLELLREASEISNPRFGAEQTLTRILEKIHGFFHADQVLLIVHDSVNDTYALRSFSRQGNKFGASSLSLSQEAARHLTAALNQDTTLYCEGASARLLEFFAPFKKRLSFPQDSGGANTHDEQKHIAHLLEAKSFMSKTILFNKEPARLVVTSQVSNFSAGDLRFLSHITAQLFTAVETIDLLDQMASKAAHQERQKMALDMHDTAIQPYLGLKMALGAIRNKADPGNPLVQDLDRLIEMSGDVITDLRQYAKGFSQGATLQESLLATELARRVKQVKELYGIDISIEGQDACTDVCDRMIAEVLNMIHEGINNICKHTTARHGAVRLSRSGNSLIVEIENAASPEAAPAFMPGSLSSRAAMLGGTTAIRRGENGETIVHLEIPL